MAPVVGTSDSYHVAALAAAERIIPPLFGVHRKGEAPFNLDPDQGNCALLRANSEGGILVEPVATESLRALRAWPCGWSHNGGSSIRVTSYATQQLWDVAGIDPTRVDFLVDLMEALDRLKAVSLQSHFSLQLHDPLFGGQPGSLIRRETDADGRYLMRLVSSEQPKHHSAPNSLGKRARGWSMVGDRLMATHVSKTAR